MDLLIFDIDGTLVNSKEIDRMSFDIATQKIFAGLTLNPKRNGQLYSTDSGLLEEIYGERYSRKPLLSEITAFKSIFFSSLSSHFDGDKSHLAIAGARDFLNHLNQNGYGVAIATGGWKGSADLKMKSIGIDLDLFPHATADDDIERIHIIEKAIERSTKKYSCSFDKCIYIGDRVWDYYSARKLGIGFIGIGDDEDMNTVARVPIFANYQYVEDFKLEVKKM